MARTQQQNTFAVHSRQLQAATNPTAGVYVGLKCESNGLHSNGHTYNGIESEKEVTHTNTDSCRDTTTSVVSMQNLSVIDLYDEVLQTNPLFLVPESRMESSERNQVGTSRKSGTWMGAWQIEARSLVSDTARLFISALSRVENWVYIFVTAMILLGVIYGVTLATWICTVGGEGAPLALQSNLKSWKSRVVYHALTDRFSKSKESKSGSQQCGILYDYCGGTYRGMEERLSYIRSMGFDAIMISPIPENEPYGYHGYWMKNLESLNPKFGTSADLKSLVDSAHRLNMLVMLDVVSNHVGCPGGGGPCGESSVAPWKYVSPFSKRTDYHPFCTVDFYRYNASNWQHCWLAGLPDLDHENPRVRRALKSWIKRKVRTFGFDGVRIDAGHLMKPEFVLELREASGVFGIAEFLVQVPTYQERTQITAQIQDYATGAFLQTFQVACDWAFLHRRPLLELAEQLEYLYAATKNPELNAIYLDNHDLERFYGRANDTMLLKNALVVTILSRGIPFVYYGTEQGYQGLKEPQNRESLWPNFDENADIYKFIRRVLAFRSAVALYDWPEQITRHADTQSYAFSRGQTLVVVTNAGSTGSPTHQEWRLQSHPYKPHQVLCNILTSGDCLTAGADGEIDIHIMNGEAKVYHPTQ